MPNIHKTDKEPISFQIHRHLMLRIKKEARRRNQTVTDFCSETLYNAIQHVTLSFADYRMIAEATARAERTGKRVATPMPD